MDEYEQILQAIGSGSGKLGVLSAMLAGEQDPIALDKIKGYISRIFMILIIIDDIYDIERDRERGRGNFFYLLNANEKTLDYCLRTLYEAQEIITSLKNDNFHKRYLMWLSGEYLVTLVKEGIDSLAKH